MPRHQNEILAGCFADEPDLTLLNLISPSWDSGFAQVAYLRGRNEAGMDQPVSDELRDPGGVRDVCPAPRDLAQVLRVEQHVHMRGV